MGQHIEALRRFLQWADSPEAKPADAMYTGKEWYTADLAMGEALLSELRELLNEIDGIQSITLRAPVNAAPPSERIGADVGLFCAVVKALDPRYPNRAASGEKFNAMIPLLHGVEQLYRELPMVPGSTFEPTAAKD